MGGQKEKEARYKYLFQRYVSRPPDNFNDLIIWVRI